MDVIFFSDEEEVVSKEFLDFEAYIAAQDLSDEAVEVISSKGLSRSDVPEYMLKYPVLLLRALLKPWCGGTDLPAAFAVEWKVTYGSNHDEVFDIVDDLGGEEKAKEVIANCCEVVRVPSSQEHMIRLLKEAGYVETDTPFGDSESDSVGTDDNGTPSRRGGDDSNNEGDVQLAVSHETNAFLTFSWVVVVLVALIAAFSANILIDFGKEKTE